MTSTVRDGLVLRVALSGSAKDIIGYRAIKNGDVIDVDRPGGYAAEDFWEPIRARADGRLILDPDEFYILASREKMQIPADLAAEMAPIDPAIGEFRVHYAGFFDPGFGQGADGRPAARAVLEVRAATCRSCSRTVSRSGGWSSNGLPTRRTNSTARARRPTTSTRGSNCRSISTARACRYAPRARDLRTR